jgi:hypothetical protein
MKVAQAKKISEYIDEALESKSESESGGSSDESESVDCVSRKSKSFSVSEDDVHVQ